TVKGVKVVLGNLQLMKNNQIKLGPGEIARSEQLESEGNSLVFMAINNQLALILGIKDQLRPNVKSELLRLRKLGVKNLILLSGDNQGTVNQVAQNLRLRSEEHTSELQSRFDLVCRLLLEKKKNITH